MANQNTTKRPPAGGGHGPGRVVEKPQDFKKAMGSLIHYSHKWLPAIIIAFVIAVASTILSIIAPGWLSKLTDLITSGIQTGIDLEAVVGICITLVIIYICSAALSYGQGFIMATVTQKITKKLRTDITGKINRMPLKYFDSTNYGDVLSRVTNDVDTIGQTLNSSVSSLIASIALVIGCIVMMLITSPIMTLAAIAAAVIGFVFMMVIMSKSQKYFKRQQDELGNINGHVEEMYSGHLAVKAYNGEKKALDEFNVINARWRDSAQKAGFLSGMMMPIMQFVGNFGFVAVCVVGVAQVLTGNITFGVVVAFMVYVRLFTNPLSQIAQCMNQLQTAAAASERVFAFLKEDELSDESDKNEQLDVSNVKGRVEFDHVRFGYNSDRVIIHDFSATCEAGQKIAIVGPTGAGKTTIVNLLMRFYDVDSGDIRIDGKSVYKLTREQVHDMFCMVLQDTWLFQGSVRENIAYGKDDISDEQIVNACKAAGIHHYIEALPQGYDTVLDDKSNLSAGEKQLMTIARAMVEKTPLLILDEATSSVDTRTEVLIQQAMDKLTKGRTSFVIAHRLSTIKNADMILVMKDGDIIEKGSHDELMSQNGFYADLYNSQFEQVD